MITESKLESSLLSGTCFLTSYFNKSIAGEETGTVNEEDSWLDLALQGAHCPEYGRLRYWQPRTVTWVQILTQPLLTEH